MDETEEEARTLRGKKANTIQRTPLPLQISQSPCRHKSGSDCPGGEASGGHAHTWGSALSPHHWVSTLMSPLRFPDRRSHLGTLSSQRSSLLPALPHPGHPLTNNEALRGSEVLKSFLKSSFLLVCGLNT